MTAASPHTQLRNIGPRTAAMLARVGIRDADELRRVGAVDAYLRLARAVPGTSLNALYALAGALEERDWRAIKRERKLDLLLAVEDRRRAVSPSGTPGKRRELSQPGGQGKADERGRPCKPDALAKLRNIGPAMLRDFALLGVHSVAQLARRDADKLYLALERATGKRQDPCVWDTFAAAIHQARTGEALPWWHFTRERKRRSAEGSFVRRPARPVQRGAEESSVRGPAREASRGREVIRARRPARVLPRRGPGGSG
ncbi:MAG TPA: helix-hairpin-helix domain-containing protein [Burkholderiaceae bacterium]|nr:helix-hairpin-helix domain-containing protein [Burkholderiaceae bacterium]